MIRAHAVLLALAGAAGAVAGATPCGSTLEGRGRQRIESATHVLVFVPRPAPMVTGRHFSLDLELCAREGSSDGSSVRVDAMMPAHRHGMNYRPTVRALAANRYRVDGLLLHMPGRWRLEFEFNADGRLHRLAHEVDLP